MTYCDSISLPDASPSTDDGLATTGAEGPNKVISAFMKASDDVTKNSQHKDIKMFVRVTANQIRTWTCLSGGSALPAGLYVGHAVQWTCWRHNLQVS